MTKNQLRLLLLINIITCFHFTGAQTNNNFEITPNKKYVSISVATKKNKNLLDDYIVTNTDTLVNINSSFNLYDLKNFCECFKSDELIQKYYSGLQYYYPKNKSYGITKQWNSKLVVHLDKSLPRTVRKKFRSFFNQVANIDNLDISFSKDIEKSNYLIKFSDTIIPVVKSNYFEDDKLSPYSNVTYKLISDNNSKIFTGKLLIDKSLNKDKQLMLKKLKQLFFMSLGPFYNLRRMPEESLLSNDYKDSKILSEFDLAILKIHYYKIYPNPLKNIEIKKIRKYAKSNCINKN